MTVFDVSCPPREAFARCIDFWNRVGIRSETPGMLDQFEMRGWTGTEITVGRRRGTGPDADWGELGASFPGLALAGLALSLVANRRHGNIDMTRLIVAARPVPGALPRSELWCFPWDDTIRGPRLTKDPLDRVFAQLEQTLTGQGILLGPPRLVKKRELPGDSPLSDAGIATMHRDARKATGTSAFRFRR